MQVFMDNNDQNVVKEVLEEINEYKKNAALAHKLLLEVENQRTRIINHIEELQHNKRLDKYMALRLEDKLVRPYAMTFLEF